MKIPSRPKHDEHQRLITLMVKRPEDYRPWGEVDFESLERPADCSAGCVYFRTLEGKLGADWGVCTNPESHRAGLLTFEHQGCAAFVGGVLDPARLEELGEQCMVCGDDIHDVFGPPRHPFCLTHWGAVPSDVRRGLNELRREFDALEKPDPESDGAPLRIAWALAAREIQRARARRGTK